MARASRHRRHARVREKPAAGYATPQEVLSGVLLDSDIAIEIGRSHGVEIADALIAAAASTAGLVLWTLNRKHYPMRDVRFFEPTGSAP